MKIYFSPKHLGKDTSELDSSYLVWILENYEGCEYLLREACQKELSDRLGLDFTPTHPSDEQRIEQLEKDLRSSESQRDNLEDLLVMSVSCKWNWMILGMYRNNRTLLLDQVNIMKEVTQQ